MTLMGWLGRKTSAVILFWKGSTLRRKHLIDFTSLVFTKETAFVPSGLFYTRNPFWKRVYSKRIEFAPKGSKFFPFRVDPFQMAFPLKAYGMVFFCGARMLHYAVHSTFDFISARLSMSSLWIPKTIHFITDNVKHPASILLKSMLSRYRSDRILPSDDVPI